MWLNREKPFQLAVNLVSINADGESSNVIESDSSDAKEIHYLGTITEHPSLDEFWLKGDDFDLMEEQIENKTLLLDDIKTIFIHVSHFTNGRAFSLAHQLRTDFKFTGKIWAVGYIIPDQYGHVLSCGFDGIKLPEKHPEPEHFIANLAQINVAYQQPDYLENKYQETQLKDLSHATILQMRHK